MAQYIDKSALVAKIEKRINEINLDSIEDWRYRLQREHDIEVMKNILSFINALEVKEIEEMYERPTIKIEDDVSVISRLQYIDDDLKQIADFILEYASWNLHKDEWNHPVLEVPLFRVLDALVQRGKPYCEC